MERGRGRGQEEEGGWQGGEGEGGRERGGGEPEWGWESSQVGRRPKEGDSLPRARPYSGVGGYCNHILHVRKRASDFLRPADDRVFIVL